MLCGFSRKTIQAPSRTRFTTARDRLHPQSTSATSPGLGAQVARLPPACLSVTSTSVGSRGTGSTPGCGRRQIPLGSGLSVVLGSSAARRRPVACAPSLTAPVTAVSVVVPFAPPPRRGSASVCGAILASGASSQAPGTSGRRLTAPSDRGSPSRPAFAPASRSVRPASRHSATSLGGSCAL